MVWQPYILQFAIFSSDRRRFCVFCLIAEKSGENLENEIAVSNKFNSNKPKKLRFKILISLIFLETCRIDNVMSFFLDINDDPD